MASGFLRTQNDWHHPDLIVLKPLLALLLLNQRDTIKLTMVFIFN